MTAEASSQGQVADARALQLRRDFDRGFAARPELEREALEDLLAIRVRGDPYALRLGEIAAVWVGKPVAPLPGAPPELLGIAGVRGVLAPIYDLAVLLGRPRAEAPRWIALGAGAPAFGLAFEGLDGQLRVSRAALSDAGAAAGEPAGAGASAELFVHGVVRIADQLRPVLHLAAVRRELVARGRARAAQRPSAAQRTT